MSLFEFDRTIATASGIALLCGVDEAGRGPLAGPVYAAAVILPPNPDPELDGLNDSKKLTEKKRETLFDSIREKASAWAIASADHHEIDSMNILQASMLAMRRAVESLEITPELVLVDGNSDPDFQMDTELLVKGDAKSACVAAASILAKVARDRHLLELDARYPEYGFAKHKGYPTKAHYALLDEYGPSPVHRQTFLRKWKARNEG